MLIARHDDDDDIYIYIYIYIFSLNRLDEMNFLLGNWLFLWHVNPCWLFNARYCLYIYKSNTYDLKMNSLWEIFLTSISSFVCSQMVSSIAI